MTEFLDGLDWMLLGGLAFGLAFGIVLQRSRFCLLSALSNFLLFRDWRHAHAWLVALIVAIPAVALIEQVGGVAISESSFRLTQISLAGSVLGGLVFGVGVVLAGGCASRTLIRAAEGNFGSLIAMGCFALAATATLFGVLAPLRNQLQTGTGIDLFGGESALFGVLGLPPMVLATIVAGLLLLAVILTGRSARRDWPLLGAGALIGVLVALAWWFTGDLAQDEFDPRAPFTLSVSGPLARATLWLTTDTLSASWFGITLVFGMLVGGFLSALSSRTYHWVMPEPAHIPHMIAGGLLMGVGAVFAGGCNVGQGLGGLSTLSCSSLVACVAILVGMRLGLILVAVDEARRERAADNRGAPFRIGRNALPGHE